MGHVSICFFNLKYGKASKLSAPNLISKPARQVSLFVENFLGKKGNLEHVRPQFFKSLIALAKGKPEITVGTICSGWGVADMVVDSLNDLIAEHCKDMPTVPKVGSNVFFRKLFYT